MINKIEQHQMLLEAGYRCEYCRRDLIDEVYEFDHIVPQVILGPSVKSNFAVSCSRCNRNKGKLTYYVDPHTRNTVKLFNPRGMNWEKHFHHVDGEVVGKTAEGRATASLLFRTTPRYSPPDLSWNKLESIARNEYLYRFLNHLRYLRLQNQFGLLKSLLNDLPISIEATKQELEIANKIKHFLQLELYFTRSEKIDIAKGIMLGEDLLNSQQNDIKEDIKGTLSILYQQRATIKFNSGDVLGARQDQKRSYELHACINPSTAKKSLLSSQPNIRTYLRSLTLEHKYDNVNLSNFEFSEILTASIDLYNESDFSHFTYLIDLTLLAEKPYWPAIEGLYSTITVLLESSGYGTNIDRAKLITIKRRWWVMHYLLEQEPWWDAFKGDLTYWDEVKMYNEIRELYNSFKKTDHLFKPSIYKDIVKLISEHLLSI